MYEILNKILRELKKFRKLIDGSGFQIKIRLKTQFRYKNILT